MTQAKMPEPLFWFRLRSDGGYEEPLHDAIIGEARKQSDAWVPFFSVSQIEAYAAAKVREALEKAESIVRSNADACFSLDVKAMLHSNADAIRTLISKEQE